MVESGDGSSYINAYTAGMKKNYNCAYFSFEYRSTGTVVLDGSSKNAKTVRKISEQAISTDFCMRYYMTAAPGDYNSAAETYRAYLEKEQNFRAKTGGITVLFYRLRGAAPQGNGMLYSYDGNRSAYYLFSGAEDDSRY